uniref:Minor capsid protein P9 transmembrane helices domain-containing protein n=1 Tax=viral metagenome TaxID=1070528 RepID=A0A6C0FAW6_9ZZZZ|tara:strand:+ start:7848 stop:8462 length:615 start_codon:yes stop_codon:yes gene_type:complete
MDPFWFNNLQILFTKERLFEFWPHKTMSINEKLNAITRFIIYSSVILTLYKNKPNPLLIGLSIIFFIGLLVHSKIPQRFKKPLQPAHNNPTAENKTVKNCTKPTKHNPFANVTMDDYYENPNRSSACYYKTVEDTVDKNFYNKPQFQEHDPFSTRINQRQFISNPVTTIPNDSVGFAKWLYDPGETCKENYKVCTGTEAGIATT